MVIFLAALQGVPRELYEAADVDGAGRWAKFRRVTLPMLRPALLFTVVYSTIGYMQFLEEPFVMTKGGPLDSTLSASYAIYLPVRRRELRLRRSRGERAVRGHRRPVLRPVPRAAAQTPLRRNP